MDLYNINTPGYLDQRYASSVMYSPKDNCMKACVKGIGYTLFELVKWIASIVESIFKSLILTFTGLGKLILSPCMKFEKSGGYDLKKAVQGIFHDTPHCVLRVLGTLTFAPWNVVFQPIVGQPA